MITINGRKIILNINTKEQPNKIELKFQDTDEIIGEIKLNNFIKVVSSND